jgi:hypothetical protein
LVLVLVWAVSVVLAAFAGGVFGGAVLDRFFPGWSSSVVADGAAPLPDSVWAVSVSDLPSLAAGSVEPPAEGVPGDGPWLWVPSVGVSAPVDSARVRDGVFDPPGDPSRVARWAGGAGLDGSDGTVLIAGHVAVRGTPGALFDLHGVAPGDLVWTRSAQGAVRAWAVTELRVTSSDDAHGDLFQPADRAVRLALVTCGGAVRDGRYNNNVVVIASPVPAVESED